MFEQDVICNRIRKREKEIDRLTLQWLLDSFPDEPVANLTALASEVSELVKHSIQNGDREWAAAHKTGTAFGMAELRTQNLAEQQTYAANQGFNTITFTKLEIINCRTAEEVHQLVTQRCEGKLPAQINLEWLTGALSTTRCESIPAVHDWLTETAGKPPNS